MSLKRPISLFVQGHSDWWSFMIFPFFDGRGKWNIFSLSENWSDHYTSFLSRSKNMEIFYDLVMKIETTTRGSSRHEHLLLKLLLHSNCLVTTRTRAIDDGNELTNSVIWPELCGCVPAKKSACMKRVALKIDAEIGSTATKSSKFLRLAAIIHTIKATNRKRTKNF